MASDRAKMIRMCQRCGLVHDDGESAYERWVTKEIYKRANGIEPQKSRLTHTYCPDCSQASRRKAA